MKTIEERALEYANELGIDSNTDYFDYCQQDYIAGATEQKAIDIDKACEWLNENARHLLSADMRRKFRKAIEEQLCQSGGNYIHNGVGFIIFDIKVGDLYLLRETMEIIAKKLGTPVVPYMGQFTIDEAIDFVRKGFKSTIAENPDYDAEGLVLKTPDGLMTRRGERIIFKIKTGDFKKYRVKYGTDDPVEQPYNPNYNG